MIAPVQLRRRHRRTDEGAVAIMVALLAVSMLGVLAIVTDFGMAYVNKQGLQNGADAAAVAVAQEIALQAPANQGCLAIQAAMSASMRTVAEAYFAENAPAGGAIESGAAGFEITCEKPRPEAPEALIVRVTAAQESPVFFGGALGVTDTIALQQAAKSIVTPAKSVTGLRPFAICQADANLVAGSLGINHVISFDNADFGCGYAPGNWGIMDFNGGSNPTGEIVDWIQDGYSGSISVAPPVYIAGNPGAPSSGALNGAMNAILDKEIVLPVFDQITGQGSNSSFRITGFVGVKICGWKFNNQSGSGTCSTPVVAPPNNYLQVQGKRFIPIGELDTSCALGSSACDNGVRLFQLAQ